MWQWQWLAMMILVSPCSVCVYERRDIVGGAAVTEEIVPGFRFSRCSYLLSLLRPQVINELELKRHGLHVYMRDPSSFTPIAEEYQDRSGTVGLKVLVDSTWIENDDFVSFYSSKKIRRGYERVQVFYKIKKAVFEFISWPST